jgi:hypothetical protein
MCWEQQLLLLDLKRLVSTEGKLEKSRTSKATRLSLYKKQEPDLFLGITREILKQQAKIKI